MQHQIMQVRQTLAGLNHQIASIGVPGKPEVPAVKQVLLTLANAVATLTEAVAVIDQRIKK